jgi:hypothetical protein
VKTDLVQAVVAAAKSHKVPFANLMAVVEIESAGNTFASVNGRQEPLIRWEGHYFDQRLTGADRAEARRRGLAHPNAGRIKNPRSQAARWNKLLIPATGIAEQAAYESCSWGLGQVMGAHWKRLGYASAEAMVERARAGVDGQLELMMRYCTHFDLIDELQRGDFDGFARAYNGPANKGYGARMRKAADRWGGATVNEAATSMLRMGQKGAKVRELQALLVRAGYSVKADGDFGPSTKIAVRGFQKEMDIAVDGVVGPETWQALSALKVAPEEEPGRLNIAEVQEVKEGFFASLLGGGGTASATGQIKEVAGSITGDGPVIDAITTGLYTVAAVIVIGGLGWSVYGYLRSRRTE